MNSLAVQLKDNLIEKKIDVPFGDLRVLRVRKCTVMTGFVRISRIYLITGFTLVADQQFVVERVYK